jgi:hypothetical protein
MARESREEENFAMGERRLGWNEKGGRQGSVYIGRFILQQESKSYLCRLRTRVILSWKSVERVREPITPIF